MKTGGGGGGGQAKEKEAKGDDEVDRKEKIDE